MNRVTAWLLTAVVGLAVGAISFQVAGDAALAVASGFVYATCTRLWTVYGSTLPGEVRGDAWETTRWSGAFVAVVLGAAVVGVTATLPISLGLRFAFQLLVVGIGWAGLLFGVAMTRAQLGSTDSIPRATGERSSEKNPSR